MKIKLLTPRVTATESATAGEIVNIETAEATRMIEKGLAVAVEVKKTLKSKKKG